jgi:hypothetical protein
MCIFNSSLKEGKLPDIWKLGNIVALFKKGDKSKTGNYRPVSLTSVVCKGESSEKTDFGS